MHHRHNSREHQTYEKSRERPKISGNMASWFERQLNSHQVQLVATAVVSGITVAGLIYGGQAIRRQARIDELKASIPELNEQHRAEQV